MVAIIGIVSKHSDKTARPNRSPTAPAPAHGRLLLPVGPRRPLAAPSPNPLSKPAMGVAFLKNGMGSATIFVVLDGRGRRARRDARQRRRAIAEPAYRGVGCDQLIVIEPGGRAGRPAHAARRCRECASTNADGSEAGACRQCPRALRRPAADGTERGVRHVRHRHYPPGPARGPTAEGDGANPPTVDMGSGAAGA